MLKVGDTVRIVGHPSGKNAMYNGTAGFQTAWILDMNQYVGKDFRISLIDPTGVRLEGNPYWYPPQALLPLGLKKSYSLSKDGERYEYDEAIQPFLKTWSFEELYTDGQPTLAQICADHHEETKKLSATMVYMWEFDELVATWLVQRECLVTYKMSKVEELEL